MKTLKIIDTWISLTLIVGFAVGSLVLQSFTMLLIGYFIVGGWQVISMVVHWHNKWFMHKGGKRASYHRIVLIMGLVTATILAIPCLYILTLFTMLFAAPFMAVYYTCICYNEVYVKMRRPLADLRLHN